MAGDCVRLLVRALQTTDYTYQKPGNKPRYACGSVALVVSHKTRLRMGSLNTMKYLLVHSSKSVCCKQASI